MLETEPDRRLWMLTVWFEASAGDSEQGETSVSDDEVLEVGWFADPPEAVYDFLDPKVGDWAEE